MATSRPKSRSYSETRATEATAGMGRPAHGALRSAAGRGGPARTMFLLTVGLFTVGAFVAPQTLSSVSLSSMLPFAGVLAIAAVGQTLVVQQRGLDLSVAGNLSLTAIVVSTFSTRNDVPFVVTLGLVGAIAVLVGLFNGLLVAKLAITPLIATFAVNALLIGAVQGYSGGAPAAAPVALSQFVSATVLGIQALVWVAIIVVIIVALVMRVTVAARRFVAVGANLAAARANGVATSRYLVGAYVAGSLCVALAGVLLAGYLRTVAPTAGDSYLLPVIAAVIIGGTPLSGGRGSVIASAMAALFLSQLGQLVLTLGAPTSAQMLVQALAIAVAAAVRGLSARGFGLARHRDTLPVLDR